MSRLKHRTALVTGGGRGIGRSICQRLAQDGAVVAVNYAVDEEAARDTVTSIAKAGGRAFAIQAELGRAGAVERVLAGAEVGFLGLTGNSRLDILVNNAGVHGFDLPETVTEEVLDRYLAVNAKAPFFLIQKALPLMPEGGRVINISSVAAHMSAAHALPYAMSKGALEQVTRHLAPMLALRGITINTIVPGATDNGSAFYQDPAAVRRMAALSPFQRVGSAAEIADVAAFLASQESRWITGACIDATGGALASGLRDEIDAGGEEPVATADAEFCPHGARGAASHAKDADLLAAAGIQEGEAEAAAADLSTGY